MLDCTSNGIVSDYMGLPTSYSQSKKSRFSLMVIFGTAGDYQNGNINCLNSGNRNCTVIGNVTGGISDVYEQLIGQSFDYGSMRFDLMHVSASIAF